jgi:nucleotide-binding universal stress UspA family protein
MTIVIAVDASAAPEKIVDAVRTLFGPAGLRVVIVHVAEPNPAFVGWEAGPDVVRDQVADAIRHTRHAVETMVARLRDDGVDATGRTIQGPVVETLLSEADQVSADLLVVGSHGHGAAFDLAIGSISNALIRKSTRPVLVVPVRNA